MWTIHSHQIVNTFQGSVLNIKQNVSPKMVPRLDRRRCTHFNSKRSVVDGIKTVFKIDVKDKVHFRLC